MICPVCRRNVPLNKAGRFPMHRIRRTDRYSFCPMSGEPGELAAKALEQ